MPQAQAGNSLLNLFPLVLIFVIFYFFLIRPQKLKEKEHQKMIAGLAKNDDVITTGGIHGTIVAMKERTLIIRIDENVKMEIDKNCIAVKKAKGSA